MPPASPSQPVRPPAARQRRGRPAKLTLTEDEAHTLRGLVLGMSSSPERQRKSLAIEELARQPVCRPEVAEFIREQVQRYAATGSRPSWPISFMRAAHVTEAEIMLHRGRLREVAPAIRRGDFICDAHGREIPLKQFLVYASDDVSINEPYRWTDPLTGRQAAGRQVLATISWYAAAFHGFTTVGRKSDAYRAEDVLDHLLDVCESTGLPDFWILEQGSWAATGVTGIEVEGMSTRWGALDPHLFHVQHADSSRGKGLIEGRFDPLQTLMTMQGGMTMGRHAGEFRTTAKHLRRVTYDTRRAEEDLDFSEDAIRKLWPAGDAHAALDLAARTLNARPVKRHWAKLPLIPDAAIAEQAALGLLGRPIPAEHRWRFAPIKRTATVRQGCVEITLDAYRQPFRFAAAAQFPSLADGYKLLVAFHPGRPDEGAWIANRERGARNRMAWGMGEIIGIANYLPMQPLIDLSHRHGTRQRRKHDAAVRTEFRPVRQPMAEATRHRIEQRDGKGNRLEQGRIAPATPPPPEPAPPPTPKPATREVAPAATVRTSQHHPRETAPATAGLDYLDRAAQHAGVPEIEDLVF